MSITKRSKTGSITQVSERKKTGKLKKEAAISEYNIMWSEEHIKDVLEVPMSTPGNIDVNLDEDEDDVIAEEV